jgi:hypothetical protein
MSNEAPIRLLHPEESAGTKPFQTARNYIGTSRIVYEVCRKKTLPIVI